eukprot:3303936-Alexandrium_andersonii.AAC.1
MAWVARARAVFPRVGHARARAVFPVRSTVTTGCRWSSARRRPTRPSATRRGSVPRACVGFFLGGAVAVVGGDGRMAGV